MNIESALSKPQVAELTTPIKEREKFGSDVADRPPLRERLVAHTVPYLAALMECSEDEAWNNDVTFQIFDDTPRKDPKRARIFHGCLDDLAMDFDRRNAEGDGIFIAVNQTDLKGREKRNITALRTAWADIDFKAAAETLNLAALPLPPTMTVRSGHGVHLYWCFTGSRPCEEGHQAEHEALLRGIQKVLAPFGADRQVCQVASVLRVPGFYNMKGDPTLVVLTR